MYDTILKNALIADGSGNPLYKANVAMFSGSIALITSSDISRAREIFDLKGALLTPGFIDIHTHTDLEILRDPTSFHRLSQGITMDINGNCGMGVFPYSVHLPDTVRDILGTYDNWAWSDYISFVSFLRKEGLRINEAFLVPHAALRHAVMGEDVNRKATKIEVEKMKELLSEELDKGAIGFSTGLGYVPCSFSDTTELIELCKEVSKRDKIFSIHHRTEGDGCLESLKEAITVAEESGVRIEISHLKAIGVRNGKEIPLMLEAIDKAKERGINIAFDQYPYNYGSTSLFSLLPPRLLSFSRLEQRMALSLESSREEIREEINNPNNWDSIYSLVGPDNICVNLLDSHPEYDGMTLSEISQKRNNPDPLSTLFDILSDEAGSALMTDVTETEESMDLIMKHPLLSYGSDSLYSSPFPHPRSQHGTVEFIKDFLEVKGSDKLPEAIMRLTHYNAEKLGLKDRGMVKEGYRGDLVIIERDKLNTKDEKHSGIEKVFVNGALAFSDGVVTENKKGSIINKY